MKLSNLELEELYRDLERPLYNFALRWVWNPSLAQELVQDTFVRVWSFGSVDRATVKSLLYKTLQNLAINELRKLKIRQLIPAAYFFFEGTVRGVDEDFIRRQELASAQRALDSLSKDLKETLLLCQFSDLSYDEIGKILKIPAGTVASRKNKALSLMKEFMKKWETKP